MSVFGAKPSGARLERVKASKQFRGGKFENTAPMGSIMQRGETFKTMREFVFSREERFPPGPLPQSDPHEVWKRAPETGLRATWLSHSTVLLEIGGKRLLTDPVFCDRASPSQLVGPKRFAPPPVPLAKLPPLDGIVLSHDHYDHADFATLRALAKLDVPIVTSLGVGAHLETWGMNPARIVELDWWEHAELPGSDVRITATPARHFSGRGPGLGNSTLWSSMVIESSKHRVFFSGDTGPTPEFEGIRGRMGAFDLVMLEVGAWHPSWGEIHLGPENALKAVQMLGNAPFLPVHWGTFNLALHAWDEPAEVLLRRAPELGVTMFTPRQGGSFEPSRPPVLDPWWRLVGSARETAASGAAAPSAQEAGPA